MEDAWISISAQELESGTVVEIRDIKYRLIADALPGTSGLYIPPGHGMREYLDEPEGMLGNWDLFYAGLDDTGVSVVKLDPSGDDQYNLEFENRQGQLYNVPYVTNQGSIFKYGDDDNDLVFIEGRWNANSSDSGHFSTDDDANQAAAVATPLPSAGIGNFTFNIGDDDFFILSNSRLNLNDETAFTHVVRFTSVDTSNRLLTFDDEAVGTRTFTYDAQNLNRSVGSSDLVFGGNTFIAYVENITNTSSSSIGLVVDKNGDGVINRTEIRITVNGGGIIDLGNSTDSDGHVSNGSADNVDRINGNVNVNWTLTTLATEFDEDGPTSGGTANEVLEANISTSGRPAGELGIGSTPAAAPALGMFEPDEDRDHSYGMTEYGVFLDLFDESGSDKAETLTIEYPLVQRGAKVFVTMGATTTSKSKAGEICTVADITPATMLDTEVGSRASSYNLILVGDSCVNKIVADLWGVSYPTCGEGLPYGPGEAVVQLMENGNKVAMVIAGYDAIDTRKAAKVVANYGDYNLGGEEATVTGTISSPQVKVQ